MNQITINILTILGGIAVGAVISGILINEKRLINLKKAKERAQASEEEANKEAENIKKETRGYVEKRREIIKQERKIKEERFLKLEESLKNKEKNLQKKEDRAKEEKLRVVAQEEEIQGVWGETKRKDMEIIKKLSEKTSKGPEELKEEILKKHEAELKIENKEKIAKTEELLKENAEKTAKRMIIGVIQRLCSPTSVETRVVNVKVKNDRIKGKIVGQNAENVKLIEEALEVDVVFNDMPNTISISGFALVKRRIAQKAMEKIVKMRGEIRKEDVKRAIEEGERETDRELFEIGRNALKKMGISAEDKDLCRTVGRLQYRTSYGQNIMKHAMEVSWVALMLGSELGLDPKICLVSGFLHDLGKAIDQEEGVKDTHDVLTKELMEKFGFSEEEVHAAWTHHDAEKQTSAEALIIKAADAVSASRPGARQESFDKYIERIRALEETATSYEGVKSAFAISAGRELRVLVDTEKVKDEGLKAIAEKMAEQIESEITYPGQIKVNVIRRTRHTEVAK